MKIFYYNRKKYYVGQNAKENQSIIDNIEPEDIWIHLHENSSPHVMIQNGGINENITEEEIHYGCALCKVYSKYKNNEKVTVCYIEGKYLKNGKVIGSVNLLKKPFVKIF